ncbi:hypothetical protein POPTR_006G167000v4 [Populus trichocarpa]|uniref:Uncharacterized protein n=2 Tax=Populus trichocarpa TaxID=3694 RepID=A0ACC0SUW0_POPTR|nr:hypothetical protein POPTR_006G167000v4 [Populus trichocarpa]KAI9392988.1 hypothetical protein POPTR_006G167000v4 [Populus trichocarpa]
MQMGYKGFLASVDSYMNLLALPFLFNFLGNTEEYIDGQFIGNLGEILIRFTGSVCKLSADATMFSTFMEFRRMKR